jgi:hypothetical protein
VEFAIVALLLFTLLMGIIEGGIMITNYMSLNTGVRETVRQIALRDPAGTPNPIVDLHAEVCKNAPDLDEEDVIDVTQSYRVRPDEAFTPGPPPENINASSTVQVRVEASYRYQRLSSLIFKDPVVLSTSIVMKRE